jgi:hypothetical protein
MQNLILNLDSPSPGLKFFLRFLLALVAGHLISTGGEFQTYTELVKLPGYPIAFVSSVIIAIVAVEQVHYSILLLHRRFPTYDSSQVKLLWQIITCFLLPYLTIFILATAYYAYHNYFILDTMWLTNHGWHIFMMLLVLNLLFGITGQQTVVPTELPKTNPLRSLDTRQIAYVLHDVGINIIYFLDGSHEIDSRTLKQIHNALDKGQFVLNPKRSIVRRDNVLDGIESPDGKFRIELISPAGTFIEVSMRQKKFYLDNL